MQWTFLAGTFDAGTGTMTLYVNGTAAGTASDTTPFAAHGAFTIGSAKAGGAQGSWLNGQAHDVQVYPRALTAAQLSHAVIHWRRRQHHQRPDHHLDQGPARPAQDDDRRRRRGDQLRLRRGGPALPDRLPGGHHRGQRGQRRHRRPGRRDGLRHLRRRRGDQGRRWATAHQLRLRR